MQSQSQVRVFWVIRFLMEVCQSYSVKSGVYSWPEISLLLHLENAFFFLNSISFSLPREDDGYQPHLLMNWYKLKEHIVYSVWMRSNFFQFSSFLLSFSGLILPLLCSRVCADPFLVSYWYLNEMKSLDMSTSRSQSKISTSQSKSLHSLVY